MIQSKEGEVLLSYNKLHADAKQGKTLDIVLKKIKHKMVTPSSLLSAIYGLPRKWQVENMSAETADALGLSRAILCNDSLLKRLEELERNAELYRGLINHLKVPPKCQRVE